jgi:hypothetical protein
MKCKNFLTLCLILFLVGCQSNIKQQSGPPLRPSSPSAICMETAISNIKKSRIAYNDSRSEGMKCFAARHLMRRAQPNFVYNNECPRDNGPLAYDSYKAHVFSLNNIDLNYCPTQFKENFVKYKNAWTGLQDIAGRNKNLYLVEFHNVMTKGAPSSQFEVDILNQQEIISKVQPELWKIFQQQTGWCHDPSDNKDVIYWRGCPVYRN